MSQQGHRDPEGLTGWKQPPTYAPPHDYVLCPVCRTPIEGCECSHPGECEVCGEAAELVGVAHDVCAGCFVPRDHGVPTE